jgi:long-chain acyl-CoA synthetase
VVHRVLLLFLFVCCRCCYSFFLLNFSFSPSFVPPQSISITTVYATLGIDAVIDSVNDGRIRAIVCNKKSVKILLGKDMPTLMVIIYTNNMIAPGKEIDLPAAPKGVTVVSFQDFVNAGDIKAFTVVPPKPDTTAVIMYTSGSTGESFISTFVS